jgi:uncharacterized membrane protein YhaH (DUF805 family)
MEWYLMVWQRWDDFQGRSRRKEYWMFMVIHSVFFLALDIAAIVVGRMHIYAVSILVFLVMLIYALAAAIPSLAVAIRRLHDIGKSGWWLLLSLVPLIGLLLVVFACFDSEPGNNIYGPNPKLPYPYPMIG